MRCPSTVLMTFGAPATATTTYGWSCRCRGWDSPGASWMCQTRTRSLSSSTRSPTGARSVIASVLRHQEFVQLGAAAGDLLQVGVATEGARPGNGHVEDLPDPAGPWG